MTGDRHVNLHVHSTFSVLDGFGTPEMLVQRAKELGHTALAITDHGNASAHPQLERACKEAGIKPIYGCEFYCVPDIGNNKQKKNHITVLAQNLTGYRNLLALLAKSFDKDHFYYRATIDMMDLFDHKEGLIILSGCLSGIASQMILEDKYGAALKWVQDMSELFGNHFYLEIQPLQLEETIKVNKGLRVISETSGVPMVVTTDCHFPTAEDRHVQTFLSSVRMKKNMEEEWGLMDDHCTLATRADLLTWGIEPEIIDTTYSIVNRIEDFDLPCAEMVKFGIDNPYETFLQLCREGWVKRGIPQDKWDVYTPRVLRELELIREKGFVDYFLIVADMIDWAKSTKPLPDADQIMHVLCPNCFQYSPVQDATETAGGILECICPKCEDVFADFEVSDRDNRLMAPEKEPIMVGMARGSAAGSLVSYLMGITEVDPIPWDLLFERFIDVSRMDFPDIDVDIDDARREEVKQYLQQKYGADKVANIGAYSLFKQKSLLDDIGRTYHIPKATIEEMKDKHNDAGEALAEYVPSKVHLAKAEGMIRQFTIHAAGVIVCSDDICRYATMGKDGIMLDHRDAEKLGLMKIDVLGLKTLRILTKCLDAIGKTSEWLYSLPTDDEETIEAFSGKDFAGIFQYEGHATKGVCQRVKPKDFRELIDINALSRPAPLQSGATERYINRVPEEELHPIVTKYTEASRGQILFQEQVMKILKEASTGLDWADITAVRKLITKKQGAEKLAGIKQRFIEGFDGSPVVAEDIFNRCAESGSYGFNLSHATAYTHLGYYCMYLKIHYPIEFYWANMAVDSDKQSILREFSQNGGRVKGVKFGKSKEGWSIDNGCLRAGFTSLKGVGSKRATDLANGKLPGEKTKMFQMLMDEGVFDEEHDSDDFMGFEALKVKLDMVNRDKIGHIIPGNYVKVAGYIGDLLIKSLKEVIESRGGDYSKTKNPEFEHYAAGVISDETGTVAIGINRYKYKDELVRQMLEKPEGKVYMIAGEYSQQHRKIYVQKIKTLD